MIYTEENKSPSHPMTILGSSASYVFAYDSQTDKTSVFPVEKVQRMQPYQPPKQELKVLKDDSKAAEQNQEELSLGSPPGKR